MKSIICAILLLLSFQVVSDDKTTVGLYYGLYTDHLFDDDVYNEDNHVLLLQYNSWYFGTFDNSFGKRSYVAAWSFYDYRHDWGRTFFQFDAAVGAATGYVDTPNRTFAGLAPALLGSVDLGRTHNDFEYGVRGIYLPKNVVNLGIFFNYKY